MMAAIKSVGAKPGPDVQVNRITPEVFAPSADRTIVLEFHRCGRRDVAFKTEFRFEERREGGKTPVRRVVRSSRIVS